MTGLSYRHEGSPACRPSCRLGAVGYRTGSVAAGGHIIRPRVRWPGRRAGAQTRGRPCRRGMRRAAGAIAFILVKVMGLGGCGPDPIARGSGGPSGLCHDRPSPWRFTSQFSYQPSSAITTRIDLMLREVVAVPARSAPTSAMDPDDPTLYPQWRSASIAWNVASSSTVIS